MSRVFVRLAITSFAIAAAFALARPGRAQAQESYRFRDVTLSEGGSPLPHAEVQVRVKESPRGAYTRADYFDAEGRSLGFYETFQVVSREEPALRAWATRNFGERTSTSR
ncbi:MAG: hypothetical protein H0V09_00690 [Gemmatimonadetes bacterium]|nr:hypothetical protein [Gemmatimonadota bacterium]